MSSEKNKQKRIEKSWMILPVIMLTLFGLSYFANYAEAATQRTVGTISTSGCNAGDYFYFNGGTLTVDSNFTAGAGSTIAGSTTTTITFTGPYTLTIPAIGGTTGVLSTGGSSGGTLKLTGTSPFTGGVQVNGTVTLKLGGATIGGAVSLSASGTTLDITDGNATLAGLVGVTSSSINLGTSTLTVNNRLNIGGATGTAQTVSSTISNSSSGGNTGQIVLANSSNIRIISNSDSTFTSPDNSTPVLTVNNGGLFNINGSGSLKNAIVKVISGGTFSLGILGSIATGYIGGLTGSGLVTFYNTLNNALNIAPSGQQFTGTVGSTASNTNQNVLIDGLNRSNKLQSFVGATCLYAGKTTLTNGATLEVSSLTQIASSLNGASRGLDASAGTTLLVDGGTNTLTSAVVGSGTIKLSNGSIAVSSSAATNTYIFDSATGLTLTFSTGSSIGGLAGSGAVTVTSGTITLSPNASGLTPTFSGTLTNTGTLTIADGHQKIGATLSGQTGGTVVNNGATLSILNNSGVAGSLNNSGVTNIASGANIGGSLTNTAGTTTISGGTITGGIIVNGGTINISDGTSIGNLIINGGTVTLAGSVSVVNATTTAGTLTNPDSPANLTVTGNLSLANAGNFGGANLTVKMSNGNDQNLTITTGSMISPLQINKSAGYRTILQSNYTGSGASSTITVNSGALYLNGKTLSATTTVNNGGELQVQGAETMTTPTLASGSTVTYVGDGNSTTTAYTIKAYPYYNLIASSTDNTDTYSATNTATILNNLIIKNGIYTASSTLTVGGNFSITGGSLGATSTSLIMSGASSTISLISTTTVASLTAGSTTASTTLNFGTTGNLVITGTTTLQGTTTKLLSLRSTTPGGYWHFQPDGARVLSYLDVMDSYNTSVTGISASGLVDSGHNFGWTFTVPVLTVGKSGTQIATTTATSTSVNLGGAFTLLPTGGAFTLNSLKFKQVGSFATSSISNVRFYYQATSTTCATTKPSSATTYVTAASFDANKMATTTFPSLTLSAGSTTCLYVTYDLTGTTGTSTMGRTIDFEITNPITDVGATGGTILTGSKVNIPGVTMIAVDNDVIRTISPPVTNPISHNNEACSNNVISSMLSLRIDDTLKNPTLFYLQNCQIWKKEGDNPAYPISNPAFQVHSLTFTDMTGANSAGAIKFSITVSNVDPGTAENYMSVTRTYETIATVKSWNGGN